MYDFIEFIILVGEGNMTPDLMKERTRRVEILFVRQLVQYFCVKYKIGTLEYIAQQTGITNHATVLNSCKVIENYTATNPSIKAKVERYDALISYGINILQNTRHVENLIAPMEDTVKRLLKRATELKKIISSLENEIPLMTSQITQLSANINTFKTEPITSLREFSISDPLT